MPSEMFLQRRLGGQLPLLHGMTRNPARGLGSAKII